MNLDELRSVQNRERQTDSLQHLRESFYEEVGTYISDLKTERERAAERADDPWSDPEIQRLTDEIETAEEVAESIYERRMGKLVKSASLAAGGYTTDTEGLTLEEERLFEDLVQRIETNKETVLDVLAGEAVDPGGSTAPSDADPTPADGGAAHTPAQDHRDSAPEPPDPVPDSSTAEEADHSTASVDAASMMTGGDQEEPTPGTDDPLVSDTSETPVPPDHAPGPDDEVPPDVPPGNDGGTDQGRNDPPTTEESASSTTPSPVAEDGKSVLPRSDDPEERPRENDGTTVAGDDAAQSSGSESDRNGLDDRKTVRITSDIGQILGVDEHEYDLAADDVVTLPEENAGPLIERDAAEPIE